ncbi:MAG: ribonucleoside-diphosphate reductase, partial [Symploca sp. SIO2G7]|nr:ribonucleoside-diphosphate reductase [Symploca sp. SIO2G7]
MSVSPETLSDGRAEIEFQDASLDIWDKKYRLKSKSGDVVDETIDDTYKRVARALADAEQGTDNRERWYREFLWALRRGVIPAGRITSNAGAQAYKPATSTINCTVSGTIGDSMHDILGKVHEAGLTLKAGCGIGYEFSTLRPKGAYVSGAGAYTSGPLSFMDIYDKMCFTVSSAGGRRGAQMATFDISHPDVMDFIRAKREDGVLRQFNCSLLITDDFVNAVRDEADWPLVFPVLETEADEVDLTDPKQVVWRDWPVQSGYVTDDEGLVACKIYKTVPAKRLWNMIMSSTYDFAEPGFILVDRINEQNNNWFVENIRATNPCVTADTRLHTQYGLVRAGDLYRSGEALEVTVDRRALGESARGCEQRSAVPVFMTSDDADVYRVTTEDGYEIEATEWHDFYTERGKLPLKELRDDDRLLVQSGKGQFGTQGSAELGVLLGLIAGDGQITHRGNDQIAAVINF